MPPTVSSRRLARASLAVGSLIGPVACSGASSTAPDMTGMVLQPASSASSGSAVVPAAEATAGNPAERAVADPAVVHRSVGDGRARAAAATADVTVVVTTVGVFTVASADGAVHQLDRFDTVVGWADIALAPDGRTAAAVIGQQSVRLYDLAAPATPRIVDVPGTAPANVRFSPDGALVTESSTDVAAWPAGPSGPVELLTDSTLQLGRAALLPDGQIVIPLRGTADVLVGPLAGPLGRQTIGGLEATVVDAQASPAGALALTVATGVDERQYDVVVPDMDAGWVAGTRISTGLKPGFAGWTLTDDRIVVAGPERATAYSWSGSPAERLPMAPASTNVVATPAVTREPSVFAQPSGLATVASDGTIALWDLADPTAPRASTATGLGVARAAPGSGTLSVVGYDGAVITVDVTNGVTLVDEPHFAVGTYTGLAAADDGTIAVASTAGRVFLFDPELQRIGEVDVAGRPVDAVAFAPGSRDVVAAVSVRVGPLAFDDTVARWVDPTAPPVFEVDGNGQEVAGCAFFYNRVRITADGALLVKPRHTYEVALVDAATGAVVHTFPPHAYTVFDVALTSDGLLVSTADDATVRVWRLSDYSLAAEYPALTGGYPSIVPLGDGSMAVSDFAGGVSVVDVLTGAVIRRLEATTFREGRLAASASGELLAVPSPDGPVTVWSTSTATPIATLDGPVGRVAEVTFIGETTVLAAAGDATLHAWALTGR